VGRDGVGALVVGEEEEDVGPRRDGRRGARIVIELPSAGARPPRESTLP